jgi:Xaa-Pro aminopeptidase
MESEDRSRLEGLSLAERDRRWNAVRKNAAQAGFDCTLVPLCCDGINLHLSPEQTRGTRADCRYLTDMDNAAIVLPTDGRPPLVINDEGAGNGWVPEVRRAVGRHGGFWGAAMADALLDAGMERARIGAVGLKAGKAGHIRAVDGVVNHTSYMELQRRLPNATFEDATDVVGLARYVKSDEEIECLRRAAAIAVAGIEEMVKVARPGVLESVLYARVTRRLLELGSEYAPLAIDTGPLGQSLARFENPPIQRRLQPMYLITNEVYTTWNGLFAQEIQPILLGALPDEWRPIIEVQQEVYEAGLAFMKPGTEFPDLVDVITQLGAKRGMRAWIMLHSRGYGDEGPHVNTQDDHVDHTHGVCVERGTVWIWKPTVCSPDGRIRFRWGGCILTTEKGSEPLIRRRPEMVCIN